MKRKGWLGLAVAAVLLAVVAGAWWHRQRAASPRNIGQTATIYLHGYSGSANSTRTLIARAEQAGAHQVLRATVARDGTVHWQGPACPTKHPLVQVVFVNNRPRDIAQPAAWVHRVAQQLKSRYGVRRLNVVAHSMGNLAFMTYAERWGNDADVPKLAAYVAIAGHYDGILGLDDSPHRIRLAANGAPRPTDARFRWLAAHRQRFPRGVRVLNLYGDLQNGSDSDGRVANNSSRSLRYLVAARARSYRERQFNGRNAQHSRLHENRSVAQAVDRFLGFHR